MKGAYIFDLDGTKKYAVKKDGTIFNIYTNKIIKQVQERNGYVCRGKRKTAGKYNWRYKNG